MNQPRLTVVVIPTKKKNPDLVLRSDRGLMCVFANWASLIRAMAKDSTGIRLSVRVAERIGA